MANRLTIARGAQEVTQLSQLVERVARCQVASLVWQLQPQCLGSCSRNALSGQRQRQQGRQRQAGSRPCLKVAHMNIYGLPHAAAVAAAVAVARNKSID